MVTCMSPDIVHRWGRHGGPGCLQDTTLTWKLKTAPCFSPLQEPRLLSAFCIHTKMTEVRPNPEDVTISRGDKSHTETTQSMLQPRSSQRSPHFPLSRTLATSQWQEAPNRQPKPQRGWDVPEDRQGGCGCPHCPILPGIRRVQRDCGPWHSQLRALGSRRMCWTPRGLTADRVNTSADAIAVSISALSGNDCPRTCVLVEL